ncbi:Inositol-1-monophosphatase [Caulifigura coniformis]|uniref:Inositol-1-monophosphatase n=1 Tax=Caulifigura coniformis TaxID=2527983 RepID=A0A517S944_9PLAN|nr:inositol monophosphatase family protein [Caulifigura coniformis]QDT52616.1 Inositol-1-monophosphatase [Caulifigura coniformis]
MTPKQLQTVAEQAARIGGAILQDWAGRITPKEKSPKNLVTEADFASQKAIGEFLTQECPGHDFLGEEDVGPASTTSDYRWIVDPLDGTSNYVHRFPFYAVSIGVEHRGQLVAGAIFDPTRNEMFAASLGGGATLNGHRIEPSATGPLASALVIASLPVKTGPESPEVRRFLRVLTRAQSLQRTGSAALNLCYVAAGRMDGFWSTSLKPWDMAAGVLILLEAGGRVTGINGGPFNVDVSDLLATNGNPLHEELAELLPGVD